MQKKYADIIAELASILLGNIIYVETTDTGIQEEVVMLAIG